VDGEIEGNCRTVTKSPNILADMTGAPKILSLRKSMMGKARSGRNPYKILLFQLSSVSNRKNHPQGITTGFSRAARRREREARPGCLTTVRWIARKRKKAR